MSNTSDPPVPTAPSNTPEQDLGAAGEGTGDAASKDRHHPLIGKVCLVTGASRGIGKGIALQLGQAGAIVYITGRTLKPPNDGVGGCLEDTAKEIEARGGSCIPIVCDHSNDEEVEAIFERIKKEQDGRLDVCVNNAFSAGKAISNNLNKKFWEQPPSIWDDVNRVGLRNHYHCAVHASKLMVPQKGGLIVNISSAGGLRYVFNVSYGVGKEACDRMAADCAYELREHHVTMVSLWPGAVRTEAIVDMLQDSEKASTMIDVGGKRISLQKIFEHGETIELSGKCVVHLAADPNVIKKTGKILIAADLADEYGFTDIDGNKPRGLRNASGTLDALGWRRLAAWTPRSFKIPRWIVTLAGKKL